MLKTYTSNINKHLKKNQIPTFLNIHNRPVPALASKISEDELQSLEVSVTHAIEIISSQDEVSPIGELKPTSIGGCMTLNLKGREMLLSVRLSNERIYEHLSATHEVHTLEEDERKLFNDTILYDGYMTGQYMGRNAVMSIEENILYLEKEVIYHVGLSSIIAREHTVINIDTEHKYIHHEHHDNTYITFYNCSFNYQQSGTVTDEEMTEREIGLLVNNSVSHGFLKSIIDKHESKSTSIDAIRYYEGFIAVHLTHGEGNNTISYFIPKHRQRSIDMYALLSLVHQETLDSTDLKILERINNKATL